MPSGIELTADETGAVLEAGRTVMERGTAAGAGGGWPALPAYATVRANFDRLGMSEDTDVMARNLEFFMRSYTRKIGK